MTETPDEREARRCSWRTAHGPHGWVLESVNYWCVGCTAATYTAAEVKVLTEAALRLGRKEMAEEIADTCGRRARFAERVPEPVRSGVREGMVVTWLAAQRLAEEKASLAALGASTARTDLSVDTDLPLDFEAGSNRLPDVECSCYKLQRATDGILRHHPDCVNGCVCCGTDENLLWLKGDHELAVQTICRACKFGACEVCR